jgi:hypothetical protein
MITGATLHTRRQMNCFSPAQYLGNLTRFQ